MHLKYNSTTGHLLHNAAGHLVYECSGVTIEQVCGCCYSSDSRAEFTLPELELDPDHVPPMVGESEGGSYYDFQVVLSLIFIAWANDSVRRAIVAAMENGDHWIKFVNVVDAFTGPAEQAAGEDVDWTVQGNVSVTCGLDGEGNRTFTASVYLEAVPTEDIPGYNADYYVIQYTVTWEAATCCGLASAPVSFVNQSPVPPVRAVSGANTSGIVIVNNRACKELDGSCTSADADQCGDPSNTGDCPEEGLF